MILCFPCQLCEFGDIVVDITPFHFEFVEFSSGFVMGIRVVPILDEILFEFFPYIDVWRGWYWSSHDPIFDASFPFSYGHSLYKSEGVCNLSVGVVHDWSVGIEELIQLEFVLRFLDWYDTLS